MTRVSRSNRRETNQSRRRTSKGKHRRRDNPRAPQLMLLAADQKIINQLDQLGLKPTAVKIEGEIYNNAFPVTREEANRWCRLCRKELCSCQSKYFAPFMLAWKVRRQGMRAVLLRREEMPIRIPARSVG